MTWQLVIIGNSRKLSPLFPIIQNSDRHGAIIWSGGGSNTSVASGLHTERSVIAAGDCAVSKLMVSGCKCLWAQASSKGAVAPSDWCHLSKQSCLWGDEIFLREMGDWNRWERPGLFKCSTWTLKKNKNTKVLFFIMFETFKKSQLNCGVGKERLTRPIPNYSFQAHISFLFKCLFKKSKMFWHLSNYNFFEMLRDNYEFFFILFHQYASEMNY